MKPPISTTRRTTRRATRGKAPASSQALPEYPADTTFATRLIAWQTVHGRNDLPWQNTRNPYRIWLSEIMLQQTQVGTVIPYYLKFLEHFPDVASLARADEDDVLRLWSGLGYYSRARNLHRAAQQVMEVHGGKFPEQRELLEALPGLGRSTAAAIAAFAFEAREAILDGNVKRVLARHFAVAGFPGDGKVAEQLWARAESLLPERGVARYTQALMDLGATVCTRKPECDRCPVKDTCVALAQDNVLGFPSPRPRKAVPERETVMLILMREDEILLEKRPGTGIWGGLWSFPEVEGKVATEADVEVACAERFGCKLMKTERLAPFAHTFTHFRLQITPLLCSVGKPRPGVQSGGTLWMTPNDAEKAAVPTPVRKLLKQLESGFSPFSLGEKGRG